MENVLGEDLPIGIYRTYDKIQNFKIRVKVRKNTSACFAERDSLAFGDSNEVELANLMKTCTAATKRTFLWQERVEKVENANVSLEAENGSKKDSVSICLFSYNDEDLLSYKWKIKTSSTCPNSCPSPIEEQSANKTKLLSRSHFPNTESWQKPLFANVKRIVKESNNQTGSQLPMSQSMLIMAALFFDDSTASEEMELCYLQMDGHGTLTVIPDFNKRKPFIFVNSRSETFEYEIENVSNVLKSSAIQREKHLMKKIEMYKRKLKDELVGIEVNKPDPGNMTFSFNCEIVSAQNFSDADIFVHYLVIIPKGWNSESNLEGVTETCRSKLKNDTRVAYYGYTFSVDVSTTIKDYKEDSLKVVFEITSVDYWGNFRNEGYGYCDLTPTPGIQMVDIYSWKIEPTTLRHKLQNYFIGGMPHLEDLTYVINPKETKDSQLSKYGVQTISSGSVTLKTNMLLQKIMKAEDS